MRPYTLLNYWNNQVVDGLRIKNMRIVMCQLITTKKLIVETCYKIGKSIVYY